MSGDEDFLKRWSRRKQAARQGIEDEVVAPKAAIQGPQQGVPAPQASPPPPLPPVESLSPESDFAPFMRSEVEPGLRRQALKTLFSDPRFNVMDGLDVYIDDYSKPDPLPPEWLAQMNQFKALHHGVEDEKEDQESKAAAAPEQLQNPMQEQPVAAPAETPPADTASEESTPPE